MRDSDIELSDSEDDRVMPAAAAMPAADYRETLRAAAYTMAAAASAIGLNPAPAEHAGLRDARVLARNRIQLAHKTLEDHRAVHYFSFQAFTDEELAVKAHMIKNHESTVHSIQSGIKRLNKTLSVNKYAERKYKAIDTSKNNAMERLLRKCTADINKLHEKLQEEAGRVVGKWADARKSFDAECAATLEGQVNLIKELEQTARHGPKKAFKDWKAQESNRVILDLVKSGHVESADAAPVCMDCRSTACAPLKCRGYRKAEYTGAKDSARTAKAERQNASNAFIAMAWARKDTDPITLDVYDDPKDMCVAYPCKHVFVYSGLELVLVGDGKCPVCRSRICVVDKYTDEDLARQPPSQPPSLKRVAKEEEEAERHKRARIADAAPLVA